METTWTGSTVLLTASSGTCHGVLGWRKWRLWVLGLDLLILGGMAVLWHWPLIKVKDIRVEGPTLWEEQARTLAVLPPDSNLFRVDPDATREKLSATLGNLATCQVKLQPPSALAIRLVSTAPVLWADGAGADGPLAIGPNGALLKNPLNQPMLPVWRSAAGSAVHGALSHQARFAAGTWSEIIAADSRYQQVISEWTHDPVTGWSMTAADGRSQFILGKTALKERAAAVACLLEECDSLLFQPCVIDARFEGLLAVRPLPEPVVDSTAADSLTSRLAPVADPTVKTRKPPAVKTADTHAARPGAARTRTTVKGTT